MVLLIYSSVVLLAKASSEGQQDRGFLVATLDSAHVSLDNSFEAFYSAFGKSYVEHEEVQQRAAHFRHHMAQMEDAQRRNPSASFTWQDWFDESPEDIQRRFLGGAAFFKEALAERLVTEESVGAVNELPVRDWREAGAVTPVKDQGRCGSCWAFSIIGNIEGQWSLASGELIDFSEEILVSCDSTDGACQGGLMHLGMKWLLTTTNGYIPTQESYPYTSGTGIVDRCAMRTAPLNWSGYITGTAFLPTDEATIQDWLATKGPLSIGVDATDFLTYTGGVITQCTAATLNHGVLLVGYNTTHDPPYWVIKNSWGTGWGEEGYIRLAMGGGTCAMNRYAVTTIVDRTLPKPTPPPPPPPPPSPYDSKVTRTDFLGPFCYGNGEEESFTVGQCLSRWPEKGSVMMECGLTDMVERFYPDSDTCTGSMTVKYVSLDTCYSHLGSSEYYTCSFPLVPQL